MAVTTLQQAVDLTIGQVSERAQQGGVSTVGIPTRFVKLDEALGGLRNDALYILGGRPGMGKTALALSMAMNIVENGGKITFVTLEMSANLLALRVLSGLTQIPALDIEYGRMSGEQLHRVQMCRERIKDFSFLLIDDSLTSTKLMTEFPEHRKQYGSDVLIVDYLSLLRDPSGHGENERLARIVGNMRTIARLEDMPVLGLVQLNREVERREGNIPTLADIRDSGAIEQDAHAVMFTYRPQYYEGLETGGEDAVQDDPVIILAKNRQGPTGQMNARFYAKEMRWEQIAPQVEAPPTAKAGNLVAQVRKGR